MLLSWGWWLVMAATVALAVFLLSPVRVRVEYRHLPPAPDALVVRVFLLWGAVRLTRDVDLTQQVKRSGNREAQKAADWARRVDELPARRWDERLADYRLLFGKMRRYYRTLRPPGGWFLRRIRLITIAGSLKIGLGDAAVTAWAIGGLWAALGPAVAWAKNRPNGRDFRARIRVVPDFARPGWAADLYCIFVFKTAHAIGAALYAGWLLSRKWLRGREWPWLRAGHLLRKGVVARGRASNSGSNENGHGEYQGHD